ncbi:MAG TPA: RsmB/NOP family class I SAM-dependent RNA methyltransferase [Lacunisphaera sp.]|jgi:16S rRNA (cytosine967-C5)-methyltransferase
MSDSSILNNAARIIKLVQAGTPADQALRDSLTQTRHYTAPGERRGISRAVFTYYRWWRWLNEKESSQKQLAAALGLQARFDQSPDAIKAATLAARAVPDWLKAEMDDVPVAWLQQLQREPALWIRPKQGLETHVVPALGKCEPAAVENFGVKTNAYRYSGITDLYRTHEFQAGEFEIQDLASQLVGHAAAPKPGETWWDACAGEGGKTMHLSDLMQNKGLIWASDRSLRRLVKLKERAARAKVFNFRAAQWEGTAKLPTKTKFDGILIDAPCSGIGTWQRNPHARWTTSPKDVHELAAVQKQLLENVSGSLKPGGRLVYAVCTLSRGETTAIADAFSAAHPELTPEPVLGRTAQLTLWPQNLNANGMFIAAWRRR